MYRYKLIAIEFLEYGKKFTYSVDDKTTIAICEVLNKGILDENEYNWDYCDSTAKAKFQGLDKNALVIIKVE